MAKSNQYVAPTWDRVYEMLIDLALRIRSSGFKPDYIVGVSRGGWTPGRILSDLLENSRTANIKIEFYVGIGKTAGKPVVTQVLAEDVTKKNVLVVDDVSDTGDSLKVAVDHMAERGAAAIKTATVYFKPNSTFKPDFYADTTSDWIIFPWERLEATKLLIEDARAHNRDLDSVREILRDCSIPDQVIDALFKLSNGGS